MRPPRRRPAATSDTQRHQLGKVLLDQPRQLRGASRCQLLGRIEHTVTLEEATDKGGPLRVIEWSDELVSALSCTRSDVLVEVEDVVRVVGAA